MVTDILMIINLCSMIILTYKKRYYYHTLNPIIDELDFKTASGQGAIILYINIQN